MDEYFAFLKELGMDDAKLISAQTVETAAWTSYRCQYGCDFYGASLCCPPHAPDYLKTREIISEYKTGILFTSQEGDIKKAAIELSRRLFLDGYYKTIAFGAGPCGLCKTCTLDKCRFPKKTIPSMEACGIDVFATARANGFHLQVVQEKGDPASYFGMVLFD